MYGVTQSQLAVTVCNVLDALTHVTVACAANAQLLSAVVNVLHICVRVHGACACIVRAPGTDGHRLRTGAASTRTLAVQPITDNGTVQCACA